MARIFLQIVLLPIVLTLASRRFGAASPIGVHLPDAAVPMRLAGFTTFTLSPMVGIVQTIILKIFNNLCDAEVEEGGCAMVDPLAPFVGRISPCRLP